MGLDRTDARGELLQEFASGQGVVCENIRAISTFQSGIGVSVIDFTLSWLTSDHNIIDWRVNKKSMLDRIIIV